MPTFKGAFFGFISLCLMIVVILQFVIVYELNAAECDDLSVIPGIAGGCLLGSFLTNFAWVRARRSGRSFMRRAAILFWTALVTIGVVASGANLGQNAYLEQICPTALESNLDFNAVQYVSIILLLFTVSAPHALKKAKTASMAEAASTALMSDGRPIGAVGGVTHKSPLVFL